MQAVDRRKPEPVPWEGESRVQESHPRKADRFCIGADGEGAALCAREGRKGFRISADHGSFRRDAGFLQYLHEPQVCLFPAVGGFDPLPSGQKRRRIRPRAH